MVGAPGWKNLQVLLGAELGRGHEICCGRPVPLAGLWRSRRAQALKVVVTSGSQRVLQKVGAGYGFHAFGVLQRLATVPPRSAEQFPRWLRHDECWMQELRVCGQRLGTLFAPGSGAPILRKRRLSA